MRSKFVSGPVAPLSSGVSTRQGWHQSA
jgi:hypothetical protein